MKCVMKGIVFTFDALFALSLVAICLPLIIMVSPIQDVSSESVGFQAESAVNSLAELKIRNVIREQVIADLYSSGAITDNDLDKPVIDVIVGLWASNSTDNFTKAQNITESLIREMLPENLKWSMTIENDTFVDTGGSVRKATATGRRIASGFMKGEQSAGYVASVYLTSIGGKKASSYNFFGGFVGQGNITAKISGLPYDANITEIYIELNGGENFDFYVNDNFCSSFVVSPGNFSVNSWNITSPDCLSHATASENNFTISFSGSNITNEYVGGGYIRLTYSTSQLAGDYGNLTYYRFPDINGLLNLYDSFYVPGTINSMAANITIDTGSYYQTLLYIGNTTIVNHTGVGGEVHLVLDDSYLKQKFAANNVSYSDLGLKTVPLRMFISANISAGNMSGGTDVVLITDLSGSMAWRLNQDGTAGNVIDNCSNPNIYLPSTSRLSLAKCLDKSFVNAILGGENSACGTGSGPTSNMVALVGFNTAANSWESLTNDVAYLESRINAYTAGGNTCVACAINRAYNILAAQSNANRTRYIVVMTDGQANYRSTPVCYNFNDVFYNFTVGESGASAKRLPPWASAYSTANNFNSVSSLSGTFAKAAADGGEIYNWNGTAWVLEQDTGNNNIYGIDLYNSTLAFAVGASAKIWRWNGLAWQQDQDFGNFDFRDVAFYNDSLAFAVGENGVIYKWTGTWALDQDVGNADLYGIDIFSPSLAFAVGSSGKIYTWNGLSWSESTDTGGNIHYSVSIVNSTKAFTASSNGRIYEWNGASWSSAVVSSYSLSSVFAINPSLAFAVGDGRDDIYEWNGTTWSRTYSKFYYQGNSTGGISCGDDDSCSLSVSQSYPAMNANYSAHVAYTGIINLTIDSVGFGPIGSCTLGNQTLAEIARSGNGTFYSSAEGTELRSIYCQIADRIMTKPSQTQQVVIQGEMVPSKLVDSFIEFNYTKTDQEAPYQEITADMETNTFPGCSGYFFLPYGINITNALRTSYSGPYWTKAMYVNNTALYSVYNLTSYGKDYRILGDPYKVYIPSLYFAYNATNTIINELGLNYTQTSQNCSQNDRLIYTAHMRASVPSGETFPRLSGGIVRIYYDLDHDGSQDGFTDIAVGANLPNFDPTVKTVDALDAGDALHDALLRLLAALNFVPGSGLPGSAGNPIDIKLSDVNVDATGTSGIPFAWGPIDIRLDVKI